MQNLSKSFVGLRVFTLEGRCVCHFRVTISPEQKKKSKTLFAKKTCTEEGTVRIIYMKVNYDNEFWLHYAPRDEASNNVTRVPIINGTRNLHGIIPPSVHRIRSPASRPGAVQSVRLVVALSKTKTKRNFLQRTLPFRYPL